MKNILIFTILLLTSTLYSQNKLALVIGNSDYENSSLRNASNDAKDIAIKLIDLGFDVIVRTNLNQDNFMSVIMDFTSSITEGDIALFFYSGHGMQVQGANYLIPINKKIYSEEEIKYKCINTGLLLDKLHKSASGTNIIILDACRDNPFSGFRSSSKGFTAVIAPSGTIISYSTAPGTMAYDGDGRNSPYTESLLECLDMSNLQIEEVFKEVRKKVITKTSSKQIPWESSSLLEEFYFDKDLELSPLIYKDLNNVDEIENNRMPEDLNKEDDILKDKNTDEEEFSGNKGTFIDERDNQEYKWVRIGDQIWMAENINIGQVIINKEEQSDNGIIEKYCYNNYESLCDKLGGLYTWMEAMQGSKLNLSQGICPKGWHISSNEEWGELIFAVERYDFKDYEVLDKQRNSKHGIQGIDVAKILKSKTIWDEKQVALNTYEFSALPGGWMRERNAFYHIEEKAMFWTSTDYDNKYAWCRQMYKRKKVYSLMGNKKYSFSVRCLKD